MRKGIKIVDEWVGTGALLQRGAQLHYTMRIWLNKGDEVPLNVSSHGAMGASITVDQDGNELASESFDIGPQRHAGPLIASCRYSRNELINGIFMALKERVGGWRNSLRLTYVW